MVLWVLAAWIKSSMAHSALFYAPNIFFFFFPVKRQGVNFLHEIVVAKCSIGVDSRNVIGRVGEISFK